MSTLARTRPIKLTDGHRAELYLSLGRALNAGLPPDRALDGVKNICDGRINRELRLAASGVRKGTGLVLALDRQGLVPDGDYAMLSCAEDAGNVDTVLLSLAERYEARHNRWRRIRGKLLYPVFILVFALFIGPLPALVAERISGADYVLRTFVVLVLLVVMIQMLQMLIRHLNASGWPRIAVRLGRSLPLISKFVRLHERADVIGNLAFMLKAGLSMRDALDELWQAEPNGLRREHIGKANSEITAGSKVADALHEVELIGEREGYAIISTAEEAGKLDEGLLRYSVACQALLDDRYDLIARVAPLLIFFMVVVIVVSGLLE